MKTTKIKDCGCGEQEFLQILLAFKKPYVHCVNCGNRGQALSTEDKAIEYWNNYSRFGVETNIEELRTLNNQENGGRGDGCVDDVIVSIKSGEFARARSTYQHDGDKISSHPKIQEWFYNNFGCRTHLIKDCQTDLCKSLKRYNDKKL